MANLLADILDVFAAAIHRPSDHPAGELHDLAARLRDSETEPEAPPASELHPDPDTPAPMFSPAPAPFGTESQPEGASFPASSQPD